MGRHPRYVPEGGALVEVTYRTVQGRFLLRPSQPVNDTVVGALARALAHSPEIGLVGIVVLSNHLHLLLRVESQEHLSTLMERFASKCAYEINKLQGWEGSVFSSRYRSICVTHEAAAQIERLEYLLSNSVKEHLVAKVEQWPGIHFGKTLLEGREWLVGKWINRTKKRRLEVEAQGKKAKAEGKKVRRKDYTCTLTLKLEQLPCWSHLPWGEYLARIEEIVKRVEREAEVERELRGMEVVGEQAICLRNPQTRPNEVESSPAPLVHAASKRARLEWREAFAWFLMEYREASELLRNGDRNAPFPEGCFPPGLPFVRSAGGLPLQAAAT
jgi:REP element-mobilizing transposase RayT